MHQRWQSILALHYSSSDLYTFTEVILCTIQMRKPTLKQLFYIRERFWFVFLHFCFSQFEKCVTVTPKRCPSEIILVWHTIGNFLYWANETLWFKQQRLKDTRLCRLWDDENMLFFYIIFAVLKSICNKNNTCTFGCWVGSSCLSLSCLKTLFAHWLTALFEPAH